MISDNPYDIIIYIGRFQPLHNGHISVIDTIKKISDHQIILIGSANGPINSKNPFWFSHRYDMVTNTIGAPNCIVKGINDETYDEDWIAQVKKVVKQNKKLLGLKKPKIGIVSSNRDASIQYEEFFPKWTSIYVKDTTNLSATFVRDKYFNSPSIIVGVPKKVEEFLIEYRDRVGNLVYKSLLEEATAIRNFKKDYESLPYAPIFQTVDVLIRVKNKILLITRKGIIGKNKLAMPGGFVNADEEIHVAASRELKEETNIDIEFTSEDAYYCVSEVGRSQIGRVITHVYFKEYDTIEELGDIIAGDDAKEVQMLNIDKAYRNTFHDDHYDVIIHILKQEDDNANIRLLEELKNIGYGEIGYD